MFTVMWGTLGWTLRLAATRADIVAAFTSDEIPAHHLNAIQPFARSTTHLASAADVRRSRRAVNAAWQKTVDFEKALRRPADRVRETLNALQRGVPAEQRAVVLAQHRRRLDDYAPLRAKADNHEDELKRLQTVQAECDAAFSQDQLLSFVKRGKYKWTPRNLAHALAGLPSIGWEQSFKRCGSQKGPWPSREYRVFQMIEKCSNQSSDRFKSALEASIRALPSRKPGDRAFREHLFVNWRYFRIAIDEAVTLEDPPERRPYRTFEIYMRRIGQGRDANEQLMVSMEELTDP